MQLASAAEGRRPLVLLYPEGSVQLNHSAAAILRLCDGTRDRDKLVREVVRRSRGKVRIPDIAAFLDEALARGWVVDTANRN